MKKSAFFNKIAIAIKDRLGKLSFRTGIIVLSLCVPCYIISFAQMALPISISAKSALWVIFFGLAKTFQYGGITIIGAEGLKQLRNKFKRKFIERDPAK